MRMPYPVRLFIAYALFFRGYIFAAVCGAVCGVVVVGLFAHAAYAWYWRVFVYMGGQS